MSPGLLTQERIPIRQFLLYGWLPGFVKKAFYRAFRGYRIGKRVTLSFGCVIDGADVEIGDHVKIGLMTAVLGKRIRIGRHSTIGAMSFLSCRTIEIGEDAKIKEQVFLGGPELPESSFRLGDRTVILQRTSINPTKPVVIGDDSGVGGHCLIFTHGSWLNALHGYPVTFAPVTIGKSVWLPWRVFVMPGATIGDGSVIGANSLVTGAIPSFVLAVGSPARVVKQAPDFPRQLTPEERASTIDSMLSEFDRYVRECGGYDVEHADPFTTVSRRGRSHRLLRIRAGKEAGASPARGDTLLSERAIPFAQRSELRSAGVHWIDLESVGRSESGGPLTEELAAFLGRYGIRFRREDAASR